MPSKSLNERAEYDRGYVEGYRLGQKDFAEKVKAEIKTFTITEKSEHDTGFNDGVLKCFNALDNIGKGDSE